MAKITTQKSFAKAAWKMKLSVAHRGPRPGTATVQRAPKMPSWKVRFK